MRRSIQPGLHLQGTNGARPMGETIKTIGKTECIKLGKLGKEASMQAWQNMLNDEK